MRTLKTFLIASLAFSLLAGIPARAAGPGDKKSEKDKPGTKQNRRQRKNKQSGQRGIRTPMRGEGGQRPFDQPPGPSRFPGRPEAGGDSDRPPGFGMPSPQEIQEMLSFIKEHFPEQYTKIQAMRNNEEGLRRIGRKLWPRVAGLIATYRRNPELGRLMVQEHQLEEAFHKKIQTYRRAADENRNRIQEEIRSMIALQFDIRQKRRSLEIQELEERLAEQKRVLEERSARKDEIIKRELGRRLHPELEF